jgi:hypothetical protein
MSELIDRARIAVCEVIQSSGLPVGTYLDSEKIVLAVLAAIRELPGEPGPRYTAGEYSRRSQEAMVDDALGIEKQSP